MKRFAKLYFLLFFCIILFKTQAQQKHFIYVESEDKQPFAVVLNGKVYSSSDYGYVIVPKLEEGNYNFTVSFPMNKYPDQKFKCVINKKDLGYKLENTADKGWALQNMQSEKIAGGNNTAAADNSFTNMLSDVVNDSNLANKNLPISNKPDTVAASANNDAGNNVALVNDTSKNNSGFITDSAAQPQKIAEAKQDTGTNMVFVDRTSGTDTINVFVPDDSANLNDANITSNINQHQAADQTSDNNFQKTDTTATTLSESSVNDTSAHSINNPYYKSTDENSNTNLTPPENISTTVINSNLNKTTNAIKEDCSKMISDDDLDKLRRKMFVQNNDNGMIQAALKYINNKCLTTNQVKTLGNIFSSDDGRYNLYDALYKNVYDYGNYVDLESQIIDPYYKRRFETMLR